MKKVYLILHYVSIINTYILSICLLCLMQRYTVGILIDKIFNIKYVGIIYFVFANLIIVNNVKISSPYQKYLQKD